MNADGTDQRRLAPLPNTSYLSVTPDGTQVIATSNRGGLNATWSVPLDGSQAVEIARDWDRARISPDGRWLGGIALPFGSSPSARPVAAVMPADRSAPMQTLGTLVTATASGVLVWAADGSGLIASTSERFNLFFYGLAETAPRQPTNLSNDIFLTGAMAPDGRNVIAARGVFNRNVYEIKSAP